MSIAMKTLAGLVLLTAVVAVIASEDPYGQYRYCFEKTGFDDRQFDDFFLKLKHNEDDTILPKFVECVFMTNGVFNEKGDFNKENYINNVVNPYSLVDEHTLELYRERAVRCDPKSKKTIKEKSLALVKCVVHDIPFNI